jgi:hypothetical protein
MRILPHGCVDNCLAGDSRQIPHPFASAGTKERKAGFDAKRTLLLHVLTTKNGMPPKILVKHANITFNENPKF